MTINLVNLRNCPGESTFPRSKCLHCDVQIITSLSNLYGTYNSTGYYSSFHCFEK